MPRPVIRSSLSHLLVGLCAFAGLSVIGLGLGCSTSSINTPQGTKTDFYGVYSEQTGAPGTLELSGFATRMAASSVGSGDISISLTGELRIAGHVAIPLTGTYDLDNGYLYFASEDGSYTCPGRVVAGHGTGLTFGPGGVGAWVLFEGGTSSTVQTWCGTMVCAASPDCDGSGSVSIAVSGSTALMTLYFDGAVGLASGTSTESAVDIHFVQPENGRDITFHGEISGTTISGTWTHNLYGYTGTWNGSTAQCSAAASLRR